jgi:hypothetical protein
VRKTSAMALCVWMLLASSTALAVPQGISAGNITPLNGNTLLVASTAANSPLNPDTFQLKADFSISNASGTDQTVSSVTVSYPGSGIASLSYTPQTCSNNVCQAIVATAFNTTLVPVFDGLARDLPTPLPATVQIQIFFGADPAPMQFNYNLGFHTNSVPLGAFFFPARQSDLPGGRFWSWGTRDVVDSRGGAGMINPTAGSQRYALDLGVSRWTGSAWTTLVEGAPAHLSDRDNSDYLIWNVPIYAVADGTVISCYRGEADHDPDTFSDVTWETGGGNNLVIQHGNEFVSYFHYKFGSIPFDLCPEEGQNDGLNIPVFAGQFLGRVGNTGRSTNPHLHIQTANAANGGPDMPGGLPMNYVNIRTLGDDTSISNLGGSPALQPSYGKTLHRNALVSPNPCGFDLPPGGSVEVSRHSIEASCFQDVINLVVARGYRPVFVDGYDVGGNTYFNATFRSGGPAWAARHGLDGAEYQEVLDEMVDDGFRLQQVDSYLQDGAVRYAALFEKRPGPNFAAFHGLSEVEYGSRAGELADAGFVPINVSTVELNGQTFWTGLFEQLEVTGWTVESVPVAAYQATFDANVEAGRTPIYVHGYSANGVPNLVGIWIEFVGGATVAKHGLSGGEYEAEFEANLAAGRLTRHATGYDGSIGGANFAAVWRSRPDTAISTDPPMITNGTTAEFGFAADAPFASFKCRLDSNPFEPCNSPIVFSDLVEGNRTFEVYALDRESVRDLSPASFTWLVDVTPPDVGIDGPGANSKIVRGALADDVVATTTLIGWGGITASATDVLSGIATVEFKINGQAVPGPDVIVDPVAHTWSFTFSPDINGENRYNIDVVATDNAGNSASASIAVIGVKTNKPES